MVCSPGIRLSRRHLQRTAGRAGVRRRKLQSDIANEGVVAGPERAQMAYRRKEPGEGCFRADRAAGDWRKRIDRQQVTRVCFLGRRHWSDVSVDRKWKKRRADN